jgi:hypothetical protein
MNQTQRMAHRYITRTKGTRSPSTDLTWKGCPNCPAGSPEVKEETAEGCVMHCTSCGWTGPFSACWVAEPAIAGAADVEFQTRLDAQRVSLQFAQKSTRKLDAGKIPFDQSPLFSQDRPQRADGSGEEVQGSLF